METIQARDVSNMLRGQGAQNQVITLALQQSSIKLYQQTEKIKYMFIIA